MKKVIKGITYNTETGDKLFVINTETKTEWIHKAIFQKSERYGQKPMFFIYSYIFDECNTEIPELDRISEDIKALSYKEVLDLYEEKYGDRCKNINTYNYIKELLDEE